MNIKLFFKESVIDLLVLKFIKDSISLPNIYLNFLYYYIKLEAYIAITILDIINKNFYQWHLFKQKDIFYSDFNKI